MKLAAVVFLVFAFAVAPASSSAQQSGVGELTGVVTDAVTGAPIEGAVVRFEVDRVASIVNGTLSGPDEEAFIASSDAAGRFGISEAAAAGYRVYVEKEGFVPYGYGQPAAAAGTTQVVLEPGRSLELEFRLVPAATISGTVRDGNGQPLTGVSVVARYYRFTPEGRELADWVTRVPSSRVREESAEALIRAEVGRRITDASGEYRLSGLAPGDYYIVARVPDPLYAEYDPSLPDRQTEAWSPVYYPDTPRFENASAIRVSGGIEMPGVDIRWQDSPMVPVRGQVVGAGGDGRLDVELTDTGGRPVPSVRGSVDESGAFEFLAVASADYRITALERRSGPDRETLVGESEVRVGEGGVDAADVTLHRPIAVAGIVVAASPTPPDFDMARLRVHLAGANAAFTSAKTMVVWPDGTFGDEGLPVLTGYSISLGGLPAGAYLESVAWGGVSRVDGKFRPGPGASGQIELRIGFSAGTIAGRVTGAAEGAVVTLVPEGEGLGRADLYRRVTADADGRYALEAVPPGTYRVFGWTRLPEYAEYSEDFLAPYVNRSRLVRLLPSGALDADVDLISPSF